MVCSAVEEDGVLQSFLERIRAWQDFMDRHKEAVYSRRRPSRDSLANLWCWKRMIESGVPVTELLDAWQGPRDGLHDFMLGAGGIEVKTTVAADGFLARVSSLDQLDESLRQPIFIAAVRLALHPSGMTIFEMADVIRMRLRGKEAGLETFEIRLNAGGPNSCSRRAIHAAFPSRVDRLPSLAQGFSAIDACERAFRDQDGLLRN